MKKHLYTYEEYIMESKFHDFKESTYKKAKDIKNLSKNIVSAFKQEGKETTSMFKIFNRQLRKKLNLKNRSDNPTPEEIKEALSQLRDIPKLAPYALIMLAAPIPGSSALYTVFAYYLNKKSNGKLNILPSSFQNVFNVQENVNVMTICHLLNTRT